MTREPDAVNPFRFPESPEITESEREAIRQISGSTAWDALNKILDWHQKMIAMESLEAARRSPDNLSFYQGRVHGFAWARNVIEDSVNPVPTTEETEVIRLNKKEAEFFAS